MIFYVKHLEEFKYLSPSKLYTDITPLTLPTRSPKSGTSDKITAEAVALLKKSQLEGARYARIRVIEAKSLPREEQDIVSNTTQVTEVWGGAESSIYGSVQLPRIKW